MGIITQSYLASFWSVPMMEVNLLVFANLLGALMLGLLVGIGFFGAAILLTILSASLMMWGPKLEARLPSRRAMGVMLEFTAGVEPDEALLKNTLAQRGYSVAEGTLNISSSNHIVRWNFVMVAMKSQSYSNSMFELSRQLRQIDGVGGLQISHARN